MTKTSTAVPGVATPPALVTFKGSDSIVLGDSIEQPPQDVVKNTLSLWQADLDTAVRYGGDLTKAALGAMDIKGDKKYILVDAKVHMLMPGQWPAIPGWHTDGAPRSLSNGLGWSPLGDGPPSMDEQQWREGHGDTPRFHLLVTGTGCLTEFLRYPLDLEVPQEPTSDLYRFLSEQMRVTLNLVPEYAWESPTCTALEWGWWHLHAAKAATKREWRFLIRVTESDYHQPQPTSKLNEIIRTQQMVYTPVEFGW